MRLAAILACAALTLAGLPSPAVAHSLTSSTVVVHATDRGATATVSVALATVKAAAGTSSPSAIGRYVAAHLSAVGIDGAAWIDRVTHAKTETVDGIPSVTVALTLQAPGNASTAGLTLTYDGVIEADPAHEAVVVYEDANGEFSTAGVMTSADPSVAVGARGSTGLTDMLRHGFTHVLAGADHLLFLIALLLPAPLVVRARRWCRDPQAERGAARRVIHLVTAFTAGHSTTLIAAALGWVAVPSAPVEILIAASVAVAALHAWRPLIARGEVLIALGFGLVHGLAFAGILETLGLKGAPSMLALLAFNLGIEAAGLVTIAAVLPWLLLLARTRI